MMTASCCSAFGEVLFMAGIVVGKYLIQMAGLVMSVKVYFLPSVMQRVWLTISPEWKILWASSLFHIPEEIV